MCKRYKQRPSEVVGLLSVDPVVALDFDFAIMLRGIQSENDQAERHKNRGNPQAGLKNLGDRIKSGEVATIEEDAAIL